jgi:hypothetical protein
MVWGKESVMSLSFDSLVDEIKKLSTEEKEELEFLVERFLVEERREEIYQNYQRSQQELGEGKLEFSSDINKLKHTLEE